MLFNSFTFAIFLAVALLFYQISSGPSRRVVLLIANFVFYCSLKPVYGFLLLFSILIDYFAALFMEGKSGQPRKLCLIASLIANFTLLFCFKYLDFALSQVNALLGSFGCTRLFEIPELVLPIGISFYTFQTLSYSIDVYRGKLKAEHSFIDFSLFITYYPQLVAGPIERASRLLPQLRTLPSINLRSLYAGLTVAMWGFALKLVVADRLAVYVDRIFLEPELYGPRKILLGLYAFSLQIYGDFAGYSLIAIGIARIMGIDLISNFANPYLADSIAEFWRRWHISLSSWFRDYLFIPVYGRLSVSSSVRTFPIYFRHGLVFFFTILITEILLGFWHGAQWTFGLFGLYHALLINLHYLFRKQWRKVPGMLRIFVTYHLVLLGWLPFRCKNFEEMSRILAILFENEQTKSIGIGQFPSSTFLSPTHLSEIIVLGFVFVTIEYYQSRQRQIPLGEQPLCGNFCYRGPIQVALLGTILLFGVFESYPFLYFQF